MKSTRLFGIVLLLSVSGACTKPDQPHTASSNLAGNWTGTHETQQTGSCSWGGPASVPTTATWQVVNKTVTGTVRRQLGSVSGSAQFTGTVNGSTVNVSETNNATCNGTPRTYLSRFTGGISGNTLTLVSSDTLCPVQNCIFRRTLKMTRQ